MLPYEGNLNATKQAETKTLEISTVFCFPGFVLNRMLMYIFLPLCSC